MPTFKPNSAPRAPSRNGNSSSSSQQQQQQQQDQQQMQGVPSSESQTGGGGGNSDQQQSDGETNSDNQAASDSTSGNGNSDKSGEVVVSMAGEASPNSSSSGDGQRGAQKAVLAVPLTGLCIFIIGASFYVQQRRLKKSRRRGYQESLTYRDDLPSQIDERKSDTDDDDDDDDDNEDKYDDDEDDDDIFDEEPAITKQLKADALHPKIPVRRTPTITTCSQTTTQPDPWDSKQEDRQPPTSVYGALPMPSDSASSIETTTSISEVSTPSMDAVPSSGGGTLGNSTATGVYTDGIPESAKTESWGS